MRRKVAGAWAASGTKDWKVDVKREKQTDGRARRRVALTMAAALLAGCEERKVFTFPDAVADAPSTPPCEERFITDTIVENTWEVGAWQGGLAVVLLDRTEGLAPFARFLLVAPPLYVAWDRVSRGRMAGLERGPVVVADVGDVMVRAHGDQVTSFIFFTFIQGQAYPNGGGASLPGVEVLSSGPWIGQYFQYVLTSNRAGAVGHSRAGRDYATVPMGELFGTDWPVPTSAHSVTQDRLWPINPDDPSAGSIGKQGQVMVHTLPGGVCRVSHHELISMLPQAAVPQTLPDVPDCHGARMVQLDRGVAGLIARDSPAADSTWRLIPFTWVGLDEPTLGPPIPLGVLGQADDLVIDGAGYRIGMLIKTGPAADAPRVLRQYDGQLNLLAELALPPEATDVRLAMVGDLPTAIWRVGNTLRGQGACASPDQRPRDEWAAPARLGANP
jgi:hypothetical protein